MGRQFGGSASDCPVTEQVSDRLLRLPYYDDLTDADQARVVSAVRDFGLGKARLSNAALGAGAALSENCREVSLQRLLNTSVALLKLQSGSIERYRPTPFSLGIKKPELRSGVFAVHREKLL